MSRRARINALDSLAVVAALLLGLLPAFAGDAPRPLEQESPAPAFPGFEPGQELRYTLEGEDGLARALRSVWSIRLEAVEDSGIGVFELTHGFGGFAAGYGPGEGPVTTARAWIDSNGFPRRVRIIEGRSGPGTGQAVWVIEYRFEDGRYVKELQAEGVREDQGVDLPEGRGVRPEVPRGLYLYMPLGAGCLMSAASAGISGVRPGPGGGQPGGGSGGGAGGGAGGGPGGAPAGAVEQEDSCRGREIVFANPGLLGLTMPALWEAGTGEHDFAFLAPTGLDPAALRRAGQGGGTGFSVGGVNLGDLLFGPDVLGDPDDAFGTFRLASGGELVELDLGEWTESAWRFTAPDPVETVWVDGQGGIVRVDLTPAAETESRLSIRRLRPSEY